MAYEPLTTEQTAYVKEQVDALGFYALGQYSIFNGVAYEDSQPGKLALYYFRSDGTPFVLSVPIGRDKQWETDLAQFEELVARAVEALRKSWV